MRINDVYILETPKTMFPIYDLTSKMGKGRKEKE